MLGLEIKFLKLDSFALIRFLLGLKELIIWHVSSFEPALLILQLLIRPLFALDSLASLEIKWLALCILLGG